MGNIILEILHILCFMGLFISVNWHIFDVGLSNPMSEDNSNLMIIAWVLSIIYLILSMVDRILELGR